MADTPRARLEKTINHRDPGDVVVDMGGTVVTGINANALARLRDALGLEKRPVKIYEPLQLLGLVEPDLQEALGLCVAEVTSNYTLFGFENKNWKPWTLPTGLDVLVPEDFNTTVDTDGTTYIYPQGNTQYPPSGRLPAGGYYFDNCFRTYKEFDEDDFDGRADFADDFKVYSEHQVETIRSNCERLYNETDLGLIGGGFIAGLGDFAALPGPHIPYPKGIRNLEDWMVAHQISPEYVHQIFAMQTEVALENARLFWEACGDKIQVLQVSGTDFGTQRSPIMAPETMRSIYRPYLEKINRWIHENTTWKVFYHSCGSIVEFLQDYHEMGVDILNPVQCSAEGMDPIMLKEKWGDKFTFWGGGVDTQHTLPFGTEQEVYEEVSERLRIFAPGGGFVFNTVHNIQGPTPVENILAMFRAVSDYNIHRKR